jgi:hypothetical protein
VIGFVASEIEKHGFAGRFDRIAFFGVSQGAIMALDAVASGRWPVRAAAATNLRLRQQAVKDFDRRRLGVVGATVRAPPLLMSPKVAIDRTVAEHDQPDVQSVAPREPDVGGVKNVNPALVNRPRAIGLKLPHSASPELDEFDDLPPDFDEVDLTEAAPTRHVSARPIPPMPKSATVRERQLR